MDLIYWSEFWGAAHNRSIIVRINDRGPFDSHRIIDLSKRAAHELGIHNTAQVRVQFLKKETDQYLAALHDNGEKPDINSYNNGTVNDVNAK